MQELHQYIFLMQYFHYYLVYYINLKNPSFFKKNLIFFLFFKVYNKMGLDIF